VRKPWILLAVAAGLVIGQAHAADDDFDPHGHHPQPQKPIPQKPVQQKPAEPVDQIAKYTKIVLKTPGDTFPLQRLAQLYRERDGNLTKLVADFESRAAQSGADQYAAITCLAGVYKIDGRLDDAIKTYEKGIALKPTDPSAVLALAHVQQDRGEVTAARTRYEQALGLQTATPEKEQTLRTLMTLALDAKDWNGAKGFHQQLVKLEPTSLFIKGELGRELYGRGEYEKAEEQFKDLVTASAGDNRTLAPALKELGKAQAKAHKNADALATLKKALAAAGAEAAVRAEIYETITEIYRADNQLPVLIKQIEDEHPSDYARLAILGALYDETGDANNAIATYRKALAINPSQIDLRLKLVRLLQTQGELDKAIAEYEALIRAAPNNPQFVFEQCEALMQRGDRTRALALLTSLETRISNDEDALSRLADFYGRIGENDKALRVLQRLTQVGANDPQHLVEVGDRYYQDGNTAQAIATWKRILTTISPRARALSALGDVYLEHDMATDALQVLKEAVQLDSQNAVYKKQLASAYERTKNYRDARAIWTELADRAKKSNDKLLAREARTHMVSLWGLDRTIDQQVAPLTAQFNANPPDIEAGRTLAEVQMHLRKFQEAEATLRKVVQLAPGDADSYLALERVLTQENKLQEAIAVLEKLAIVDPKSARQLYQRMADYASRLYKDADAIKYAARAVELNPDDAEGHRRLAEMYRSKQDVDHAIAEFRAAIAKNDRLFTAYFSLAELVLSKGGADEADRLYRRVIRGAPDEDLVARAARLSMQINLGRGTLESLEQDLLPLAIGNPQRSIYRRLLVEIYGNLTFALVQRVKRGEGRDAEEARAALVRIGTRAVKPLLDALADGDQAQQHTSIDVLAYVQNKNAGPALFAFATGNADVGLRQRAMVACGALRDPNLLPKYELRDPNLLPKYEALLFPKAPRGETFEEAIPSDAVGLAAVWGVARITDRRAVPLLRRVLSKGTAEMRALAAIGLAQLKDTASVAPLAQTARTADAGNEARAAAAYALGELGAESETATLMALAQSADLPRELSLFALARMGAAKGTDPPGGKAAIAAMADAVFAGGDFESSRAREKAEALQRAGSAALVLLASGGKPPAVEPLPIPDGNIEVTAMLESLVPRSLPEKDRAAAVVKFAPQLERAAVDAVTTAADRARSVLEALGTGEGALKPFISADPSPISAAAQAKARGIAAAIMPTVIGSLARHPDATLRTRAVVLLARSPTPDAQAAVVAAVGDSNESVQRVALAAIGAQPDAKAVAAVGKLLETHENWAMRVLGAQALGRLGASGASDAAKYLQASAKNDSYALVREASLKSLAQFDMKDAVVLAAQMATSDPEPRVRETAKTLKK